VGYPSLIAFSPEILVTVCALGIIGFDAVLPERKSSIRWVALGSLLAAMALSAWVGLLGGGAQGPHFDGALVLDGYTTFARLLFGCAGVLVILASWDFYGERAVAEYFALFLLSLVGEVVIVSGTSMLMLFIGIELLAIPTYAMVSLLKQQEMAVEAGLKYFLLGMFASVVMLYGTALLYGALGTVSYLEPLFRAPAALTAGARGLVLFGFFFVMMGVGFKIVAFPFHFWSPDVYAGGATPVVAYVSTVPKVAIVIALFRILGPGFAADWPAGRAFIAALAVLSMVYGNVVALMQDDVRRMLAYSGIANSGYMLIALASGGADSYSALLFFLVVYTFTNLGAFFVVLAVSGQETATLDDFAGLGRTAPALAFSMALFMFSLGGTPPLAGFFGKFALFRAAVVHGYWYLALVALLTSVVSLGYYLRVAQQMYSSDYALSTAPGAALARLRIDPPLRIALAVTAAATLLLGVAGIGWLPNLLG
jgi:NADH-quinone oxidoreductase subunit N